MFSLFIRVFVDFHLYNIPNEQTFSLGGGRSIRNVLSGNPTLNMLEVSKCHYFVVIFIIAMYFVCNKHVRI